MSPHVISPLNMRRIALWQHTIFTEAMDRTQWSRKSSRSAVFLKKHICENKWKSAIQFWQIYFVSNEEKKSDGKKLTPTQHLSKIWPRNVTYHSLDTYQNYLSMENRVSRHVWLKAYLRCPINYRILNSSSKTAELKQTLMQKCTAFSVSGLFQRFLLFARSGSTRYYITLSNKISSDFKT